MFIWGELVVYTLDDYNFLVNTNHAFDYSIKIYHNCYKFTFYNYSSYILSKIMLLERESLFLEF